MKRGKRMKGLFFVYFFVVMLFFHFGKTKSLFTGEIGSENEHFKMNQEEEKNSTDENKEEEEDTIAPVIKGVKKLKVFIGDKVDYKKGVKVTDNKDEKPMLTVDIKKVKPEKVGIYKIFYIATDKTGNKKVVETTLEIKERDKIPPVIIGVKELKAFVGDKVDYKNGITLRDNEDRKPVLEIDSKNVNLDQAGIYEIAYIAKDRMGNQATIKTTIHVMEKLVASQKTEKKMADVLSRILKQGMTEHQKAEAIYYWIKKNIRYTDYSKEKKYAECVDRAFTKYNGDCFVYAAVAQGLLTKAGIENMYISRIPTTFHHNWNIVKIKGVWSHFDTCPRRGLTEPILFMSDEKLMKISDNLKSFRYAFRYDRKAYPVIK